VSGSLLPFRRPVKTAPPAASAVVVTLELSGRDIVLGVDDFEIDLTPEQARALSADLYELANDAEGRRG